ncbi:tyrosine-type recombinase/integrase [Pseudoclavibacter albus]|uniref:tyrosine-type recombinase/integrase n=1 Tax=Pseudoclavibacter albus TaxID=272241 RepID=UPI0035CD228E
MPTLADIYDSYAELLFDGLASNSIAAYRRAWALRVGPTLGTVEMAELTPLAIMAAHASWTGSASTRQDGLALVSRLCGLAVAGGIITANPVRSMPRKRVKVEDDPAARALDPSQISRMLSLAEHHPHARRLLGCLVYAGVRLGEAAGITRDDVDHAAGIIRIRRTISPDGNGRMTVGPTKGRHARAVPIIPALRPILAEAEEAARGDRLFTGKAGGPMDSGNLSRALHWPTIRDQIKVFPPGEAPLRFHDLRHTAAVEFFRHGLSAPDVQRILGHSSLTVTERYARSTDDAALRAVAAFTDSAEVTFLPTVPPAASEKPLVSQGFLSVAEAGLEPATSRL